MIATDLDDIIVDFEKLLRDEILSRTGYDISHNREKYYIDIPGMTNAEAKELIDDIVQHHSHMADEIPGAIDAFAEIHKIIGRDILIITARESEMRMATINWLRQHVGSRFPYEVRFTEHKSKNGFFDKDTRFFVDDHPYFVNEAAKVLEHVFLMDKGWNQNLTLRKNVTRIKNLDAILHFLRNLLKMESCVET